MVDGGGRPRPAAAHGHRFLQQPNHPLVPPIAGHRDQALGPEPHPGRFGPGLEEDAHRFELPLPCREVDGLRVPVLGPVEVRVAGEQSAKGLRVARRGGAEGVPDVAPPARPRSVGSLRLERVGPDHPQPRLARASSHSSSTPSGWRKTVSSTRRRARAASTMSRERARHASPCPTFPRT